MIPSSFDFVLIYWQLRCIDGIIRKKKKLLSPYRHDKTVGLCVAGLNLTDTNDVVDGFLMLVH